MTVGSIYFTAGASAAKGTSNGSSSSSQAGFALVVTVNGTSSFCSSIIFWGTSTLVSYFFTIGAFWSLFVSYAGLINGSTIGAEVGANTLRESTFASTTFVAICGFCDYSFTEGLLIKGSCFLAPPKRLETISFSIGFVNVGISALISTFGA